MTTSPTTDPRPPLHRWTRPSSTARCARSASRRCCPPTAYTVPGRAGLGTTPLLRRHLALPGPGRRPGRRDSDGQPLTQRAVRSATSRSCSRSGDGTTRSPCVRQHLPAPRARAAARGWHRDQARAHLCPYHAWSYDLDGALIAAPGFRDRRDLRPPTEHGLVELPVAGVARLGVRDTPTGDGRRSRSTSAISTTWSRRTRPSGWCSPPGTRTRSRRTGRCVTENYHECYHCPLIHPELCQVSPPTSGDNYDLPGAWVGGSMDLRDGDGDDVARRRASDGPCPGGVDPTARCSTSGCSPTCCSPRTPTT